MSYFGFGYVLTECDICGMSGRHRVRADGSCPTSARWVAWHMDPIHRPVVTR